MELKKVDKSVVVDKVRREVKGYSFLFWFDAYLKPRRTTSQIIFLMSLLGEMTKKAVIKMFKRDEVSQQEYDEVEPVDQINNKKRKPEATAKKAKK